MQIVFSITVSCGMIEAALKSEEGESYGRSDRRVAGCDRIACGSGQNPI